MALYFLDRAMDLVRRGDVKVFEDFDVPEDAIGCGFHEAVRGVLSHHLVVREGKIANYHPYPPTPWNAEGIVQDPDDPRFATGTARRSTGINSKARNPIDPRMPNLTPA